MTSIRRFEKWLLNPPTTGHPAILLPRLMTGGVFGGTSVSVSMDVFGGRYNISMLVPIVRAAVCRPPERWRPEPPRASWAHAAPIGEGS